MEFLFPQVWHGDWFSFVQKEYNKGTYWSFEIGQCRRCANLIAYSHLLGTEQLFPLAAKLETAVKSKSPPNKRNPLNVRKLLSASTKARCETSETIHQSSQSWCGILGFFLDNHLQEQTVWDRTRLKLKGDILSLNS